MAVCATFFGKKQTSEDSLLRVVSCGWGNDAQKRQVCLDEADGLRSCGWGNDAQKRQVCLDEADDLRSCGWRNDTLKQQDASQRTSNLKAWLVHPFGVAPQPHRLCAATAMPSRRYRAGITAQARSGRTRRGCLLNPHVPTRTRISRSDSRALPRMSAKRLFLRL